MKKYVLLFAIVMFSLPSFAQLQQMQPNKSIATKSNVNINEYVGRYKMYQTENTFNLLKLDTATGKIDQVQWSLEESSEGYFTVNDKSLTANPKPGLFEVYPTKNMFQFILLNKDTGDMWHVQWGLDALKRWIRRI